MGTEFSQDLISRCAEIVRYCQSEVFQSYQIRNPARNAGASITPGQYRATQTSSRPGQTDSMRQVNPRIPCTYEDGGTALASVIPHSHPDRLHNSRNVNMESQNQWPASHGQNQNYQWQVHPYDLGEYQEQQTSHIPGAWPLESDLPEAFSSAVAVDSAAPATTLLSLNPGVDQQMIAFTGPAEQNDLITSNSNYNGLFDWQYQDTEIRRFLDAYDEGMTEKC